MKIAAISIAGYNVVIGITDAAIAPATLVTFSLYPTFNLLPYAG